MIIKIFPSSSINHSIRSLFKHIPENWDDSFIDTNWIKLPLFNVSKKEVQSEIIKEFNTCWKLCGNKNRYDLKYICYSIIMYFNPNDRSLNTIEQEELIKDWLQMNLEIDLFFYIAFLGNETLPRPIHIILLRTKFNDEPRVTLSYKKNLFVTREIEKKYNLTLTNPISCKK